MWLTNYWFCNQLQSYQPSNRLEIAIPRLFSEWCVRLYIFSWFVNSPPDQEGGRKKRMIITKNKVPAAATGSQKDQGALSLALSLSLSLHKLKIWTPILWFDHNCEYGIFTVQRLSPRFFYIVKGYAVFHCNKIFWQWKLFQYFSSL